MLSASVLKAHHDVVIINLDDITFMVLLYSTLTGSFSLLERESVSCKIVTL